MLKLNKVNSFYGNIQALHDVTLEVNEGEIVTLIGANGAGKSSTLMCICGVVPCESGNIEFQETKISSLEPHTISRMGISQIPEGRRIFPALSVQENLDMGAYLRKEQNEINKDLDHIFSLFPRLAERRKQAGGTLSGGEQQMLAISRALMSKPKLLLLDEPSLGLAPLIVQQIFEVIKKINQEDSVTIFLVEQNANIALKTAPRGYVMQNGVVTMHDSSENLLANDQVKCAYLGG